MEANLYTYFHMSQSAYFEYDVSCSDGAGETTEVRRYSSGRGRSVAVFIGRIWMAKQPDPSFSRRAITSR